MGFGQVFDILTFKHMTALREKMQSVADYLFHDIYIYKFHEPVHLIVIFQY